MKQFILTALAICCIASGYASQQGTYHVDDSGCVTVGASRIGPTAPSIPMTPRGPNGIPQPSLKFKF